MNLDAYAARIGSVLRTSTLVLATELNVHPISEHAGYFKCTVTLVESMRLSVAEYVLLPSATIVKYRYHLQSADGAMMCRWDNSPHHPRIETHPHHQHLSDGQIVASGVRNLQDVVEQLHQYISA